MAETVLEPCRKPTEADRRTCRVEYVEGKGSGPVLAKKYGLAYSTVRDWIAKEGWQELKDQRDLAELSRIKSGSEIQPPQTVMTGKAARLQAHLDRIDSALDVATDPKDIVNLARARGDFEEQLHVAIHGVKPGTAKTTGKQARRAPVQLTPTIADESPGSGQDQTSPATPQAPLGQ